MPTMIRPEGKPRRIMYKILGKPANLTKPSREQRALNRRLWFEETQRAR